MKCEDLGIQVWKTLTFIEKALSMVKNIGSEARLSFSL